MNTKKLYYAQSDLRTFSAKVLSCEQTPKGFQVILDQTGFFPTGGGQACDLGTLDDCRVLDVREQENAVVHLCDKALSVGRSVIGTLDWARRLDQMQQHTGEHIVSGLIHKHFGLHNVGFHVGADVVTIDFDGPLSQEDLQTVQLESNRAVWENIPVHCWYPEPEELERIPYRSKKALPWPVRIVQIPGCDTCACCGVHVAYTGQIGLVKLLSCVKFHQGVRIEMACGGRALDLLDRVYEQNRQVSQAFSAKLLETGEAARRMNEQLSAEKFRAGGLEQRVFDAIAQGYTGRGSLLHFEPALGSAGVRDLADRIARVCGGIAAVFSGDDVNGYSLCLVSKTGDVKELGAQLCQALSGRGGGRPGFFQGSVLSDRAQIEAFFATHPCFTHGQATG